MKPNIEIGRFLKSPNSNNAENDKQIISNSMLSYLVKVIVMCLCLTGCIWQIALILKLYFSYPATVFVSVRNMPNLQLPGITLCNNNRLMMSKLKNYDSTFRSKWATLKNSSSLDTDDLKLKQQALIDETLRNMLEELTVSKFMEFGHTAEDFIVTSFLKCATDTLHPDKPCIKYANVITTSQDLGNCFTLFHRSKSEVLKDIAIESGLAQSPVIRGKDNESVNIEQSIEPFHPNEVLRMKVHFRAHEYTTLNEPVLGHVIIHDSDEIPVLRERSFLIQPGNYYEFFVNRQVDLQLPRPYATDCVNHNASDSDGSDDINEYLHHPLSRGNCIVGCMAQKTMDKCNCWPPELPFIKGTVEDSQENKMKWCNWDSNPTTDLIKPENMSWFQFCFSANENGCNKKCKSDCSTDRNIVNKEYRTWPQSARIEHDKNKAFLSEMRRCCAIVSVRYWSSEIVINRYQPKFEIAEIMSYIGGLLSMWLGFSLLGAYDMIEAMVLRIIRYLGNQTNKTNLRIDSGKVPTVQVYDPMRMNYDQQYRTQFRRNNWLRKAKVAAIVDRFGRSASRESNQDLRR